MPKAFSVSGIKMCRACAEEMGPPARRSKNWTRYGDSPRKRGRLLGDYED